MSLRHLPLPRPMLLSPGSIASRDGWSFELEYDGFRAIVSTEDGLQVRRRVFDGVAFTVGYGLKSVID